MGTLTFRQFNQQALEILREEFSSNYSHPLEHGIGRAKFQEEKLKRLIALAQQADFATARRRMQSWERQLLRLRANRERMENTKAGIFSATSTTPSRRVQEAVRKPAVSPLSPRSQRARAK